jgi:hypothetical protein
MAPSLARSTRSSSNYARIRDRLASSLKVIALALLVAIPLGCTGGAQAPHDVPNRYPLEAGSADQTQVNALRAELAYLRTELAKIQNENALLRQKVDGGAKQSPPLGVLAAAQVVPSVEQTEKSLPLSVTVYVTATGTKYHTSACRYASAATAMLLSEAQTRYQPCKVCGPPVGASTATASDSVAVGQPAVSPRPTASSSGGQCTATTQKGTRCKRKASAGSSYCWQHGK